VIRSMYINQTTGGLADLATETGDEADEIAGGFWFFFARYD
jgi:hypothetical protein